MLWNWVRIIVPLWALLYTEGEGKIKSRDGEVNNQKRMNLFL
jgi:hypothetical protein